MKKILLSVIIMFSLSANAEDKKVYIDDCEHWYEIALGILLIKHEQEHNLYEALGFIDQYLTESGIGNLRKRRIIQRAAEVWIENHEIGSELIPKIHKKCDIG